MVSLPRTAQHPEAAPRLAALAGLLRDLPPARQALLLGLHGSVTGDDARGPVVAGLLRNLEDNPGFAAWLRRLATELGDRAVEVFFRNLVVKHAVEGHRKRLACLTRHGFFGPHTIVINPTMACNLRCTGCYAAGFDRAQHMDYALLRKVLGEARELGVHFVTVSGGEPLLYPHLERMAEEFDDLVFMVYTNATLLDEERVARLERRGNLWPAISVEGYAAETDRRRGPGVYAAVERAMRLLRRAGVMFGFSATPTRENSDLIADDRFLDHWLERGVLFGWMFQYLPLGRDPDVGLMSTPAQRDRLRAATRRWSLGRPIFVGDFWNDGACVGGCLSASKYCYVATDGAVQPCTFVPFATHNVRDHGLVEIFTSPLFRAIRQAQPYDKNLLRACKIIDRPECLRAIVAATGARPTYPGADAIVSRPEVTAHLDRYAREWEVLSDAAWQGEEYHAGRDVVIPFLGRIDVSDRWPERMARAGTLSPLPTSRK
jgi:MoaA/NifB/PqqE/SkfB family radical SAM enzyme